VKPLKKKGKIIILISTDSPVSFYLLKITKRVILRTEGILRSLKGDDFEEQNTFRPYTGNHFNNSDCRMHSATGSPANSSTNYSTRSGKF
jgi:hypothetical protein